MLFSWGTRENRRKPQIACDHSWTITDAAATRIWFYVFISAALSEHLHSSACWAERAKINMQRVSAVLKRPKRADSGRRYSLSQTLKPSKRFIHSSERPMQRNPNRERHARTAAIIISSFLCPPQTLTKLKLNCKCKSKYYTAVGCTGTKYGHF